MCRPRLSKAKDRRRQAARLVDTNASFPFTGRKAVQGHGNGQFLRRPGAAYQGQVPLVHLAVTQLRMKSCQCRPFLRYEQNARCFAVQSMHEFEKTCVRSRAAQLLDKPKRNSASAVYGEAGRLVDGDQRVIFVQDLRPKGLPGKRRGVARSSFCLDWGDADDVALRDSCVRAGPPLVQAHLAAAKNSVDVTLGYAFQDSQQEIVDSLAVRIVPYGDE